MHLADVVIDVDAQREVRKNEVDVLTRDIGDGNEHGASGLVHIPSVEGNNDVVDRRKLHPRV